MNTHKNPPSTYSSHRKKDPMNARRLFWKAIKSWVATGSIPCWGLPFESIIASFMLKDKPHRLRDKKADLDK